MGVKWKPGWDGEAGGWLLLVNGAVTQRPWGCRNTRGGLHTWEGLLGALPQNNNPHLETFQSCPELSVLTGCLLPPCCSTGNPARPQNRGYLRYVAQATSDPAASSATSSTPHPAALQPVFTEQWDVPEKA